MIHLTRALVRRWLESLIHVNDTPERTAAAFGMGVMFGFSPFLGFHTILALGLAFLLDLNRVAVLLGVYANLPWILPAYYTFTTMFGAAILHTRIPPEFGVRFRTLFESSMLGREFWFRLTDMVKPLMWPYVVGSTFGALFLGVVAYGLALAFVKSRRRLHDLLHHQHHHE